MKVLTLGQIDHQWMSIAEEQLLRAQEPEDRRADHGECEGGHRGIPIENIQPGTGGPFLGNITPESDARQNDEQPTQDGYRGRKKGVQMKSPEAVAKRAHRGDLEDNRHAGQRGENYCIVSHRPRRAFPRWGLRTHFIWIPGWVHGRVFECAD
jgi:hypothetical protein